MGNVTKLSIAQHGNFERNASQYIERRIESRVIDHIYTSSRMDKLYHTLFPPTYSIYILLIMTSQVLSEEF
jgi:hypothetical protein